MADIPVNKLPKQERLIHIIPLGDDMPYDFKKPHRHDYFEFFVFTKGGGTHFIDFTGHEIEERAIHIIFPSQIHLLKRIGAKGYIVICKKEFITSLPKVFYTQLFSNTYSSPCVTLNKTSFDQLLGAIQSLEQEVAATDSLSSELVKSYTSILLGICIRSAQESQQPVRANENYSPQHLEVYRHFTSLLEANFEAKETVSFYATQMGLSSKILNNCIRKITGKTCVDLLQERTHTEAKRLLLYTDESSKEIAYTLSFKDCSYFTRFFKKLEGVTPGEFKTYWEEKYHS